MKKKITAQEARKPGKEVATEVHQERRTRRKRTVVVLAAVAALVGIAALVLARRPILEEWHLWRLESSDPETRLEAMAALARMRSPRGASRFAEMVLKPEDDARSGMAAMWSLLFYGCETWAGELRRTLAATGQSEAEFVQRNSKAFLLLLRDMTGKEQRSPATLEDLCETLTKFKAIAETMK